MKGGKTVPVIHVKVSNHDVRPGKSESMISENSYLLLFYYGRERLKCGPVVMLSNLEDIPLQWEVEQ